MRGPGWRLLIAAVAAACLPVVARGQAREAAAPVTVAVRIEHPGASAYRLEPADGVRAVTPLTGSAPAGDLPLTFFLPPTLPAGRQRIATLVVGGTTLPVWYEVPERRGLRIAAAADLQLSAGSRQTVTFTAENVGNVTERAAVVLSGAGLDTSSPMDSVTVPAGGTAPLAVRVAVPRDARPGTTYVLRVALTAGTRTAHANQRITVAARRRASAPVEAGVVGDLDGMSGRAWVSADLWLSDSTRLQVDLARGSTPWPRLASPRAPGFRLTAPGWRAAGGEVALPRATELVPWITGTGARFEVGRARGWSFGGAWIRDPLGGTAGLASTMVGGPGLQLTGGVLALRRDGESVVLPTIGASTWGPRARAALAAGVLHSGSGAAPIGTAQGQVTAGAARLFGALSHTGTADFHPSGVALSTSASGGIDLRLPGGSSLFATAGASRAERDSGDAARPISSGTTLRAGARTRVGPFALSPGLELRAFGFADVGRRGVFAATTSLSWGGGRGPRFRADGGWEEVTTPGGTSRGPRAGAELAWSGSPGWVTLSGTYGAGTGWSTGIGPTLRAQLQAGLRTSWASLDANASLERQASGSVVHGSASASLHVGAETDVLLGIRRIPRSGAASPWEVALGVRSTLAVPLPRAPDRRVVYHDVNANGRRDSGEPGIPGLPLRAAAWSGMSDGAGRYRAPEGADVVPDLSALGPGWRIGSGGDRAIAVVRRGSLRATAYFADLDPHAVERIPRGSILLVGPDGATIAAEVDREGSARWSDLPDGRYLAYHVAPGAAPAGVPSDAVSVAVRAGAEAVARVPAAYAPRRMVVRQLDGGDPGAVAAAPTHGVARADSAAVPPRSTPGAACRSVASPTVRPRMSEAEVRCVLGAPDRVSSRGDWSYWFYARAPAGAGGVYDDIVFFRQAAVVTAILREPGRRYDGPPPHQQFLEAFRAPSGR